MDAIDFGNFIMELRDTKLSRPEMAAKSGYHVNTIKSYEKEGRLPDIDYLALLSEVSGHSLIDLINKRLVVGKFPNLAVRSDENVQQAASKFDPVTPHIRMSLDEWLQPPQGHMIEVLEHQGQDMIPFIMPGALLAVDVDDKAILAGGFFVMILMGQRVTRMVEPLNEAVLIKGGPDSLSITVSAAEFNRLQVLGRVIGIMVKVGSGN